MRKADTNGKSDTGILRANDIIPPYHEKNDYEHSLPSKEQLPQNTRDNTKDADTLSSKHENAVPQKAGIPKFDLAKQILSEQRKIASIKRKSPDKRNKAANYKKKAGSIDYTVKPPPILSYQKQRIAEIVRRDIQKLKKR